MTQASAQVPFSEVDTWDILWPIIQMYPWETATIVTVTLLSFFCWAYFSTRAYERFLKALKLPKEQVQFYVEYVTWQYNDTEIGDNGTVQEWTLFMKVAGKDPVDLVMHLPILDWAKKIRAKGHEIHHFDSMVADFKAKNLVR